LGVGGRSLLLVAPRTDPEQQFKQEPTPLNESRRGLKLLPEFDKPLSSEPSNMQLRVQTYGNTQYSHKIEVQIVFKLSVDMSDGDHGLRRMDDKTTWPTHIAEACPNG